MKSTFDTMNIATAMMFWPMIMMMEVAQNVLFFTPIWGPPLPEKA